MSRTRRVREWLSDLSVSARELLIEARPRPRPPAPPRWWSSLPRRAARSSRDRPRTDGRLPDAHNPPELVEGVSHVRKAGPHVPPRASSRSPMARIVVRGLPPDRGDQRAGPAGAGVETHAACAA